jgi:hypothetical protein
MAKNGRSNKRGAKSGESDSEIGDVSNSELLEFMKNLKGTLTDEIQKVHYTVNEVKKTVSELQLRVTSVESRTTDNSTELSKHSHELEKIQIELRKLNLIVVGLDEEPNEDRLMLLEKVSNFVETVLECPGVSIDSVFRLGQVREGISGRNIKIKFAFEVHRNRVWNNRGKPREKKLFVFINEDLPPVTQDRRKTLREEAAKAVSLGKSARVVGDKLIMNDVTYKLDTTGSLVQAQFQFKQRNGARNNLNRPPATTTAGPSTSYVTTPPPNQSTVHKGANKRTHQEMETEEPRKSPQRSSSWNYGKKK